jgi:hypothetical protein
VSVSGLTPVVVTVTQAGVANITLNLTLLLQGLYSGSGNMFMAHDATGPHWGGTIADKINVELHSSSAYSTIVFTANNIDLNTNGTATVIVPGTYNGSYYITIRHRNSLATVTSLPVSFSSGTVSYNFTTAVTSAYGNNLLSSADNRFLIYAGDVSQDGVIDAGDLTTVENASTNFISGYVVTDVNGDGVVDSADLTILDNNSSVFIRAIVP